MRVVAKVRLILNGKPLCGKSSLAQRLAENYNLEAPRGLIASSFCAHNV